MKLGIINSVFAQAGADTRFGIEKVKEIGFDTIDIFTDPLDINERERGMIRKTCGDLELPITSVVCIALGLTDFNPSVQRFHVERCKVFLDLCKEFSSKNLLLVLGEYIWENQVIPNDVQWKTGVENVRELGKYASMLGLQIAIELEPFKLSLINSVESMVRFVDDVDVPDTVLANCDISHLHLMKIPPSEVARLRNRIAHVHLSDCDGNVHGDLPPGRGVTPIRDYLAAIRDTGFNGTVSIELEYPPDPGKVLEWVAEAYVKTDRIMQMLECRN